MEDPELLARRLYTANIGLVDLLLAVAQELERMASAERYGANATISRLARSEYAREFSLAPSVTIETGCEARGRAAYV